MQTMCLEKIIFLIVIKYNFSVNILLDDSEKLSLIPYLKAVNRKYILHIGDLFLK